MIASLALALAVAQAGAAPTAARDAYRTCVLGRARSFHATDLSGDPPQIVGYAAIYSCSRERFAFVQATETFMRTRHSDLGPGSLAKVVAIFVEQTDVGLEDEIERIVGAAGPTSGRE